MTLILKGDKAIESAKELILNGDIVAFPTETVYGLGANVYDEGAVAKIFDAKGRPQDNPLIVHIIDKRDIDMIARDISDDARLLIDEFMPGAITLVLPKKANIPSIVTAGLDSVGVRFPSNAIAQEFIRACGVPIAAPSANKSMHISPTKAEHVMNDLGGRIPLVIDGEDSDVGIESTVIDMTGNIPTILRPGAITQSMIESVLRKRINTKEYDIKPASPGMKYRHYSPRVPMVIVSKARLSEHYSKIKDKGLSPVMIVSDDNIEGQKIVVGKHPKEIARNIYSALRQAEIDYDYIIVESIDDAEIGHSIMNRLTKACKEMIT